MYKSSTGYKICKFAVNIYESVAVAAQMINVFLLNQGLYDDSDCDSAELDHSGSAEPSQPPSNW